MDWTMDAILSLFTGVISGIISSLLIRLYWFSRKPKLLISESIAKNSRNEYRIKIINPTKRCISNISIHVQLVHRTNGTNGIILNTYDIKLPYSTIQYINPYSKKDENATYAIRFVLPNDLETIWNDYTHKHLKLIITCSNIEGTVSNVIEKDYRSRSAIKNGVFECGKSMRIVEE